MVLRHSYGVHRLQDGATIRDVQAALGLRRLQSALIYLRYALPVGATSPFEALAEEGGSFASRSPVVPAPDIPPALPFEPPSISLGERASLFCRSLKLHLRSWFLAFRNAVNST